MKKASPDEFKPIALALFPYAVRTDGGVASPDAICTLSHLELLIPFNFAFRPYLGIPRPRQKERTPKENGPTRYG